MNSFDKKLILDLALKKISERSFLKKFSIDCSNLEKTVMNLLNEVLATKNPDDVEYSMLLGFTFNLFNQDFSKVLTELLSQDWHYKHEDIVSILQELKPGSTVFTTARPSCFLKAVAAANPSM